MSLQDDYNRKIIISVKESSKDVIISTWGKSEEPKLEFCPLILEMKPCLPASTDIEGEVIVKNPCSFPIEFFCLEFDTQYMEEEKVKSHKTKQTSGFSVLLIQKSGL